jgi:hypothetical protein
MIDETPPPPRPGPDAPDSAGAQRHSHHEHRVLCAGWRGRRTRAHQGEDQPATQPPQPVIRTERELQKVSSAHKVLTYVEYRAVSDVFQNIDPPPPLSTQRVCPPSAPKAGR